MAGNTYKLADMIIFVKGNIKKRCKFYYSVIKKMMRPRYALAQGINPSCFVFC